MHTSKQSMGFHWLLGQGQEPAHLCFWVCSPSSGVEGPAAGFGFGPKGNRHVQGGMGHALHGVVFASGRGRWVLRAAAPLMGPAHQWGRRPWTHAAAISRELSKRRGFPESKSAVV